MFLSQEVTLVFEQATELININTDAALEKNYDGINRAGDCMKKTLTLGKNKTKTKKSYLIPSVGRSGQRCDKL